MSKEDLKERLEMYLDVEKAMLEGLYQGNALTLEEVRKTIADLTIQINGGYGRRSIKRLTS